MSLQTLNELVFTADVHACAVVYEITTDTWDHKHFTGGFHRNGDRMPADEYEQKQGASFALRCKARILSSLDRLHPRTELLELKFNNELDTVRMRSAEANYSDYLDCVEYLRERTFR